MKMLVYIALASMNLPFLLINLSFCQPKMSAITACFSAAAFGFITALGVFNHGS